MFKTIEAEVWAFDAEWVPDASAGRVLYELPPEMSEAEVVEQMWAQNGATEENPRPYLKLALCRVVSIAFVRRRKDRSGNITLELRSQPKLPIQPADCDEAVILSHFFDSVGKQRPQLVGFNSKGSDLPILVQRGIIQGIQASGFCERPDKPWEGVDYFAKYSDWHVDLLESVGEWGKARTSLNELARPSGIPSKVGGIDGASTAESWLAGDVQGIVQYNEQDALTTYLLWLQIAFFAGHLSARQVQDERKQLRKLLEERAASPGNEHLAEYLEEWDRLRKLSKSS